MPLTPEQEREFLEQNKMYSAPQNAYLAQVAQMPEDQAVRILRLSMQAGIDPIEAARNPMATVQNLIGASDFEDVGKIAPKTYAFLNDPLHMAIVRDKKNVMTLADLENSNKAWTALSNGVKSTIQSGLGSIHGLSEAARYIDKNTTSESVAYDIAKRFSAIAPLYSETLGRKAADGVNSELLKRQDVKADSELGQYGLDVLEAVPQFAAQVGAALLTGGTGAAVFMGSQIAGSEYLKLREEGVNPERALQAGLLDAAAQAPLEKFSLDRILKKVPG
ncbi:MAG: hypothetical protein ACRDBM_01085, partial [Sporomusa sp.]